MRLPSIVFLIICLCVIEKVQSQTAVKPAFLNLLEKYTNVRDFTISDNGKEAYFSAQSPLGDLSVIMKIKQIDGRWTTPEIASYSGEFMDLEPFLAPDELKLYFASNRPTEINSNEAKDYDIWFVERKDKNDDWSEPINLGSPVNTNKNEFYPALSNNGNLYFTSDSDPAKKDDILVSVWKDGAYEKPKALSDSINSTGYEFNAYVAPDESFLIFSGYNRPDGMGSGDLYVSYRKKDDSWSEAVNMGKIINSRHMDYCPFVNLSSNLMYFTSKRNNIEVPEDGFSSAEEYLDQLIRYENGMSRIYVVSFEDYLPKSK